VRSSGKKGASLDVLRGHKGGDFEGQAKIHRSGAGETCSCFGHGKDRLRIILIKGFFIFVFADEDANTPLYAISLAHMRAQAKKTSTGYTMVLLESSLGDAEYEFSFEVEEDARKFTSVVKEQAAHAEAEEVRKRLGHGDLLTKRASVRYAEDIAKKKVEDQPDAPVTNEEIMAAVPVRMEPYGPGG